MRLPADAELILGEYQAAKSALLASGLDLVACHNDPMPGNFLVADDRPMKLVDYEFASNNERAYELALLTTEMFYTEDRIIELRRGLVRPQRFQPAGEGPGLRGAGRHQVGAVGVRQSSS